MTMTTPTPIETFEDILAAMENNPRLQAAMRQHVLDQEFLHLPAIVRELQQAIAQLTQLVHDYIAATDARLDRLEADVAILKADVAELKTDVAELKTDVAVLKTDVAELKVGQARLDGNMNRLIGADYERKAARRAARLAERYLGLADMRVIYAITLPDSNSFPAILDAAVRAGRMNLSEADELEEIDIVMRSPTEYAVAEVSVTVDESDVQRARERAELLSKAVAEPVRAAVIGAHAIDSASQVAAANRVAVITLPE